MSWLLAGAVALLASFFLFLAFGYYNYFRDLRYLQDDLNSKAQIVARRLSGELLIAPRGAPYAVAQQVSKELNLADVQYGAPKSMDDLPRLNSQIYSQVSVPFMESQYKLRAAIQKPAKLGHFNFSLLAACILIIGLTVGTGLFLQTRYLRRHLIRPIESLVDTSTGERHISDGWPQELKEISYKLNSSFQDRERVIYSQIARGVIHDIKTILQSMKVATDLAKESPSENRLQNLLKVTHTKLPSLLELIDTTLDGSREIPITPQQTSLTETISRSLENVQTLPIASNKIIDFIKTDQDPMVEHDSIQMERVFTNLFKNGLEAIESKDPTGGTLRISFNLSDKNFVGVVVEDNGVGLPKKTDSIFRLLKSTKPHGSGLGLIVSKKIVEAHGGRLTADRSKELCGARFEVALPKGGFA